MAKVASKSKKKAAGREPPRPPEEQSVALRHFVEEIGLTMEYAGMPRMAGRILGFLLICDPPEQTAEEIARSIDASRASVSTMTRLLLNARIIVRQAQPGERRDLFSIHSEAFERQLTDRMRLMTQIRGVLERGLSALEGAPEAQKKRLREMHELYTWMEHELPRMLDRFRREKAKKNSKS